MVPGPGAAHAGPVAAPPFPARRRRRPPGRRLPTADAERRHALVRVLAL
ncbi:MAG: hypothetical protein JWN87_1213, partial [Frankiales bacterium]|nr:hypothetical protein [Frankiales bacterium]